MPTSGPWGMSFGGSGRTLPGERNRLTLHPTFTDARGIPTPHIDCAWSENELAMHRDMGIAAAELLEAAAAVDIRPRTGDHRALAARACNHAVEELKLGNP